MSAEILATGAARAVLDSRAGISSRLVSLRAVIIFAGVLASILFVVVGLRHELQLYADGSIFSYAVAARDAWAFHWHNISGRIAVYLFCHVPAELYVWLTGDPRGGIAVYGFLFFASQLLGLAITFAADGSRGRVIFTCACLSVACLCPLVFGYPTEMWMTHALFWPALAICHYARPGIGGAVATVVVLTALVLTHESAVIFASAVVATTLLRGIRDDAFRRATAGFLVAMLIWTSIKLTLRPDSYFSSFLSALALNAIDIANLRSDLFLLLAGVLSIYALAFFALSRVAPAQSHIGAALLGAGALAIYWTWFDQALHAQDRYYARTALLIMTPALGVLAAWHAIDRESRLALRLPLLARSILTHEITRRAAAGGLLLVVLVHAVETAKFVAAWTDYKAAVRALAMSEASDPVPGHPQFVSSAQIDDGLNRLAWSSTTQFLSVLLVGPFAPQRIVVDTQASYFWISCKTATANEEAIRAVPAESRRLIRLHACLHR